MKELEWSQDFPHYNPMGAIICCHGNQSFDQILGTSVATNVGFCHLLITYARSLDLDQDRQNIILKNLPVESGISSEYVPNSLL